MPRGLGCAAGAWTIRAFAKSVKYPRGAIAAQVRGARRRLSSLPSWPALRMGGGTWCWGWARPAAGPGRPGAGHDVSSDSLLPDRHHDRHCQPPALCQRSLRTLRRVTRAWHTALAGCRTFSTAGWCWERRTTACCPTSTMAPTQASTWHTSSTARRITRVGHRQSQPQKHQHHLQHHQRPWQRLLLAGRAMQRPGPPDTACAPCRGSCLRPCTHRCQQRWQAGGSQRAPHQKP
jgi:hypothetical protein